MKLKDNTIYWKSTREMYQKEIFGVKPNTVRILSKQEYHDLIKYPPTKIIITNIESDLKFGRILSDITYFRPNQPDIIIGIFSWRV